MRLTPPTGYTRRSSEEEPEEAVGESKNPENPENPERTTTTTTVTATATTTMTATVTVAFSSPEPAPPPAPISARTPASPDVREVPRRCLVSATILNYR